jgi:hypothetical protein
MEIKSIKMEIGSLPVSRPFVGGGGYGAVVHGIVGLNALFLIAFNAMQLSGRACFGSYSTGATR